jgi:4-amino-4-deoxy-L-arabinose transferase-like glycosyltransferase
MNWKSLTSSKKIWIIGLLIVVLGFVLRAYKLDDVYVFNFDEEYQATYAWTLVKDFHPIWIGVSASFLDFYLGPYFTYFTAFWLWISRGDPMITAYVAIIIGAINVAAVFYVGKKFFGNLVGIVSALLFATLPLYVYFDQKYWNVSFVSLTTLGFLLVLKMARQNKWWWLGFPFLVGVILETDLAGAPLVLVGLYYLIKSKAWKDIKLLLCGIIVFLIMYWPLIVFDLNHNYSNLTLPLRLQQAITENKNKDVKFDPVSKFRGTFDTLGRVWYLSPNKPNSDEINFGCTMLSFPNGALVNIDKYTQRTYAPFWLSLASLLLIIWFVWYSFKTNDPDIKLLRILLLSLVIFYFSYPGGTFEYYLLGILSLTIFIPGIFVNTLKGNQRKIALLVLSFPMILGIYTVLNNSDEFSMRPKRQIIDSVMARIGTAPFRIEGKGFCHDYEGWRYLFKSYGRVPVESYTDKNLGWLYPDEIQKDVAQYRVILSEERIPLDEDLSKLEKIQFGGYAAYIEPLVK